MSEPDGLIYSERGFAHLPEIKGTHSETVIRTYESSAVIPSLWVAMEGEIWTFNEANGHTWPNGEMGELTIHLRVADAEKLRDHLTFLIEGLKDEGPPPVDQREE